LLLHVVARGRIGRGPEAELVDRYAKRIGWPLKITELPDQGGRVPPRDPDGVTVALDERGEQLSSVQLARHLDKWRDAGRRECRFLIGAADQEAATTRRSAPPPTCSLRSAAPHGRIFSPARC
jgi:23S rRNA (pseudouridine1915-N3)-methyltransferase